MTDQMRNLLTRGGTVLGIFVLGILAGWLLHGTPGSAKVSRMYVYDDWRLVCPKDSDQKTTCAIFGTITESGQRVGEMSFALKDGNPDKHVLIVRVPLGVLLTSGVGVQVGSDTQTFPYSACDAGGCVVMADVDDKLLDEIAAASNVGVVVSDARGRSGTLNMSIKGYNEARSGMNSTEARRHSWWRRLWS